MFPFKVPLWVLIFDQPFGDKPHAFTPRPAPGAVAAAESVGPCLSMLGERPFMVPYGWCPVEVHLENPQG